MKKNDSDREYAITLLLACIDSLARELAVISNLDPQYLITVTMLKKTLIIQYEGLDRVLCLLEDEHKWLVDQIENLIH